MHDDKKQEEKHEEPAPLEVTGDPLTQPTPPPMNRRQRRTLKALERSPAKTEAFKQRGRP